MKKTGEKEGRRDAAFDRIKAYSKGGDRVRGGKVTLSHFWGIPQEGEKRSRGENTNGALTSLSVHRGGEKKEKEKGVRTERRREVIDKSWKRKKEKRRNKRLYEGKGKDGIC